MNAVQPVARSVPVTPALSVDGLQAGYGRVTVLRGVDLTVGPGQVVALLGANGAGKTTLLRATSGALRATGGTIRIGGVDVTRARASERSRSGLCLIPEGRGIFRNLSVEENLRLSSPPWIKPRRLDPAYQMFPALAERRKQVAGTLSGGQQQMLALSRAFLSEASVVLVDEVSVGLAPVIVDAIFEALRALAAQGKSLLLVEQYVQRALAMADTVYLMKKGELTLAGRPADLDQRELMAEYLGQADSSHRSEFR
jgi:branched-chain amino acid transport system ATP-binding protein